MCENLQGVAIRRLEDTGKERDQDGNKSQVGGGWGNSQKLMEGTTHPFMQIFISWHHVIIYTVSFPKTLLLKSSKCHSVGTWVQVCTLNLNCPPATSFPFLTDFLKGKSKQFYSCYQKPKIKFIPRFTWQFCCKFVLSKILLGILTMNWEFRFACEVFSFANPIKAFSQISQKVYDEK